MPTINVNSLTTFGAMSNQAIRNVYAANDYVKRLSAAVANAASGFNGTAGTEYEVSPFGVSPSATPGAKGSDWAFAVNTLATAWATFMSSAQPYLDALDNG